MTDAKPQGASFGGLALRKSYARRDVLNGINLLIDRGEITGLLGPSGAGKTTVFRILTGVDRPDDGVVVLDGKDITALGIDARARHGVGYVQQSPDLFLSLSTRDNLAIGLEARGVSGEEAARALSVIARTFLIDRFLDARVGGLSGGQRKLLEIGFAMCARPNFLLLDEPFAKLDPINVDMIGGLLRRLARTGVGILLTDHKARTVFALADKVNIIDDGAILASGPSAQVAGSPALSAVFPSENRGL